MEQKQHSNPYELNEAEEAAVIEAIRRLEEMGLVVEIATMYSQGERWRCLMVKTKAHQAEIARRGARGMGG